MKKHFLSLLALILVAQILWAVDQSYYATINNTQGTTLRDNLTTITLAGPQNMSYAKLWTAYYTTDVYPTDSVGKAGKIWDMYSNVLFTPGSGQCGTYSNIGDCYNREHSLPKSWFNEQHPAYYDMGHIIPTDGKVNGQRSNWPFGECANGTRLSKGSYVAKGKLGSSTFDGYTNAGTVFEPDDEYKGDFARMYMYMRVRYKSMDMTYDSGSKMFNDNDANYGMTNYSVALLMKWHRMDPVSKKEVDRNNGMQSVQNNRNPFIDYPILAEYLWGTKTAETFSFDKAIASFDPEFILGVSDGSRGGVGPTPTPTVKYGLSWSVNGTIVSVDSIAENQKPTQIPATPASCSTESDVFMGWTTAPISGTSDEAPAILYKAAADFPALTADITYYAVFAKAQTSGGATPTAYVFDADHQEGWSCNAENKGQYWLLDQNKQIVSPAIDLMYLESITVNMRTYGGTQYNQLQVAEETGVLTTIEATDGTIREFTWNNNLYIAGTSTLTFTCSNGASSKGVGVKSIVINAGGAATTYNRYITSCQDPSELIDIVLEADAPAKKVLVGGQIYILVGDQLFSIQGQRVK